MTTYYAGAKYGQEWNPDNIVAGTSSAGATLDVEVRMEGAPTYASRENVVLVLQQIIAWINSGGQDGAGSNMPGP